jgi:hypothetical protein
MNQGSVVSLFPDSSKALGVMSCDSPSDADHHDDGDQLKGME